MPPLDGAFALAQNLDVAVLVGQNLEFDVARIFDQLLHVQVAAGKCRGRFGLRLRHQGPQLFLLADDAHAAPAAARRGFEHHRIADALRDFDGFFQTLEDARGTGQNRHAVFFHGRARDLLQAHAADHVRRAGR